MHKHNINFVTTPSEDDVRIALQYISASCERDYWAKMGMAVKSEFGDSGFSLWHEWSQSSDSYDKASCLSTWRSIRKSGKGKTITIATLFAEAAQRGWKPEKTELSESQQRERLRVAEARRRQRELEEVREKERSERWREVYRDAFESIWPELLQPFTKSEYIKRKGIKGRSLSSPLHPFVMLTDIKKLKISVITGRENIHRIFNLEEYKNKDLYSVRYFKPGVAVVPLRDIDGRIYNAQLIQENGRKYFFAEAPTSGLFHLIGEPEQGHVMAEAEGFATGETIHLATGWPVFVAFYAHNLLSVARKIKAHYQPSKLIVCGDDDSHSKVNAGRKAANEVSKELGAIPVFPNFKRKQA